MKLGRNSFEPGKSVFHEGLSFSVEQGEIRRIQENAGSIDRFWIPLKSLQTPVFCTNLLDVLLLT